MDAVRYAVALFLVCTVLPMLLFWPLVHGWVGFWRRLGPGWTYGILLSLVVAGAVALYSARETLLAVDFGTRWPLVILGGICLAVSAWLRGVLQRDLPLKTLVGLPELAPDRHGGPLLTSGAFSWVRHPRYAQFSLGLVGWSLFANHLALYALLVAWLLGILGIAVLEERELRQRYGTAYDAYARRVPRFLPRLPRRRA